MKSVLLSRNPNCKIRDWTYVKDNARSLDNVKELYQRSLRFDKILENLKIQLRYSILALLSENKVTIFNDDIINLMGVLERDFNVSDEEADFGSFLVDRMHMHLSPTKKPYENL